MKRFIVFIIACALLCAAFTGCQKTNIHPVPNAPPETPAVTAAPTDSQAAPAQGSDLNDNKTSDDYAHTYGKDPRESGEKWAKMWFESAYADKGISDVKPEYLSSASFWELSDSFEISPMLYSVRFISEKPIDGAQKQSDGKSTLKVLVVTGREKGNIFLLGFIEQGKFDEYDVLLAIYDVVSKDPTYSSKLKPLPEVKLPKEFSQIDMRLISGGRNIISKQTLPGGIVAVVCGSPISAEPYDMGVALFDLMSSKSCGYVELGKYSTFDTKVINGKLVVNAKKDYSSDSDAEIFNIDSKGNMTTERYTSDKPNVLRSPDGSKYAYSGKGSLYVVDVKDNVPKSLISGNDSEGQDRKYYYPFAWADNTKLVYAIAGYEWSNGCGVVDVVGNKDTYFEQAGLNASPKALKNGKLYTETGVMDAPLDPGVIDLNDEKYSYRKVFKNKGFIEGAYFEWNAFSPDGTKIGLLKTSLKPYEKSVLYICSSDDGSILKTYEFQTGFPRPQYLDFFENGRIAIYSGKYAFCAEYMYIVNCF